MKTTSMTPDQITLAHTAFRAARVAGGLEPVTAVNLDTAVKPTKTNFIIMAARLAKLAGLTIQRPRGPVDGEPFARSIHELCEKMGVDASTGAPIANAAPVEVIADEDVSTYLEEDLTPDPHICRDTGAGFCAHCMS